MPSTSEERTEAAAAVPKSNRRILIIGGPKSDVDNSLYPHEILRSKNLETSLEILSNSRPDLVVYFSQGKDDSLEEHVMTWLIEGFRGKFILFDPNNRVGDFEILLESQVVDEYFSGPVSPARFVSIIKSQLTRDVRFASPRAMTTFDLFRNLFDRGLNAIFFLGEDLEKCVTANLRAEQMTGRTLYELRQIGLHDLIFPDQFDRTLKIIRRANRHYYDARGTTVLRDRLDRRREVAFSCGVFKFGRKNFVKVEIQDLPEAAVKTAAPREKGEEEPTYDPVTQFLDRDSFLRALDRNMAAADKKQSPLSLILFKMRPAESTETDPEEETTLLKKIAKTLEEKLRQTDIVARISHYEFAILLPKMPPERVEKLLARLQGGLKEIPPFRSGIYSFEIGSAQCPPGVYPFMHLLRTAS
jgi:GGDEF domain-containing protein